MSVDPSEDERYPIGRFDGSVEPDAAAVAAASEAIAELPARLREAIAGLDDRQLDTPYREGGWTLRQVVHHVADSHLNAAVRIRLALTEEEPTIRPYEEKLWAELPDARGGEVEPSLRLLEGLHARWSALLRAVPPEAFARTWRHPDLGVLSVAKLVALYAWHGRHHTAHVTRTRRRHGW